MAAVSARHRRRRRKRRCQLQVDARVGARPAPSRRLQSVALQPAMAVAFAAIFEYLWEQERRKGVVGGRWKGRALTNAGKGWWMAGKGHRSALAEGTAVAVVAATRYVYACTRFVAMM